MILFLQYTITDLRTLTEDKNILLKKPSWPTPAPFKEFVKGSGQIIERKGRGLNNWIGENYLCKIEKGIKIPIINAPDLNIKFKNISKHQYTSEGNILTKYELVFKLTGKVSKIDKQLTDQIISYLLSSKVLIKDLTYNYKNNELGKINTSLREFYILGSTKGVYSSNIDNLQLIKFCTPQIYFYLENNESFYYKKKEVHALTEKKLNPTLCSYLYKFNNNAVRIWIQKPKPSLFSKEEQRNLRISILRTHSEFECLNNVFNAIEHDLINVRYRSPESQTLQFYLKQGINTILKERVNIDVDTKNSGSTEIYNEIFSEFKPGDLLRLKNKIKQIKFRPQIENKTFSYIENLYYNKVETSIENSNIGVVGNNSKVNLIDKKTNNTNIDYESLIKELAILKSSLKLIAEQPDEFESIKNIAVAEQEASKKNLDGVIKFLKLGGKWVFENSTKIGVDIITEMLKRNI